jgi:hypothetical protein
MRRLAAPYNLFVRRPSKGCCIHPSQAGGHERRFVFGIEKLISTDLAALRRSAGVIAPARLSRFRVVLTAEARRLVPDGLQRPFEGRPTERWPKPAPSQIESVRGRCITLAGMPDDGFPGRS